MKRKNVRTLFLIVSVFTYLMVGAAIFDALESKREDLFYRQLLKEKEYWIAKYNFTTAEFDNLMDFVLNMKSYKFGAQWKFAGAFYFVTTVITTIGYGHSTPKTPPGKLFCIAYAISGIPLNIIMFHSIGERLNNLIIFLLRQAKRLLGFKNQEISTTSLMFVITNMIGLLLFVGATTFAHYEKWTYLESFYYCFITLTAIGFGDFVALQRDNSKGQRPDYVAFSLLFIFFGHSIVCCGMNLLVLRCMRIRKHKETSRRSDPSVVIESNVETFNNHEYNISTVSTGRPIATVSTIEGFRLSDSTLSKPNTQRHSVGDSVDSLRSRLNSDGNTRGNGLRFKCCSSQSDEDTDPLSIEVNQEMRCRRAELVNGYCVEGSLSQKALKNEMGQRGATLRRWAQRSRYTVTRKPVIISHLLAMGQLKTNGRSVGNIDNKSMSSSLSSNILSAKLLKRASI